jgi:hypothetical protein
MGRRRAGWTGVRDFDDDRVENEFTVGQMTALTVYQASLPPPRRTQYSDPEQERLSRIGEQRFEAVGCTSCHKPFLPLRSAWFFESSHFNRPGSIVPSDVRGQIALSRLRQAQESTPHRKATFASMHIRISNVTIFDEMLANMQADLLILEKEYDQTIEAFEAVLPAAQNGGFAAIVL